MTALHSGGRPDPDSAFGRVVHMAMFDHRMTTRRLAREMEMHETYLSKKILGQRPWTLAEMIRVANILQLDLRDMLAGMWPTAPPPQVSDAGTFTEMSREGVISIRRGRSDSTRRPDTPGNPMGRPRRHLA
ncbi:MAG TPA: hypothetical protein VE441_00100, partial [Mycobacterium sp.]|nr:hypothetical protein [Mycobacterium sp.]